ncbi:hypothetical protein [Saccharicrinis aurantiacus]|uniref:hypothetical protein n=1 Tax=Saccharicrinis aurantiacus TaxID=1849719 RepID=UPI00094F74E1|nr:hypothetical protein [Saccharicrinis aurantiacus]
MYKTKCIHLLVINLLLVFNINAYAQVPEIGLSYPTAKADTTLPFDQPFNIKLKDVPDSTSIDALKITFYPILRNNRDSTKYTLEEMKGFATKRKPIYEVSAIDVGVDKNIGFPFHLHHSTNYYIEITSEYQESLDNADKAHLKAAVSAKIDKPYLKRNYFERTQSKNGKSQDTRKFSEYFSDLFQTVSKEINNSNSVKYSFKNDLYLDLKQNVDKLNQSMSDINNLTVNIQKSGIILLKMIDGYNIEDMLILSKDQSKIDTSKFLKYLDSLGKFSPEKNLPAFSDIDTSTITMDSEDKSFFKKELKKELKDLKKSIDKYNKSSTDADKELDNYLQTFLTNTLIENTTKITSASPTFSSSFTKRASYYYTADLGYLYSPYLNELLPTLSISLSFRPINKSVPLSDYKKCDKFWVRTNLFFGITLSSLINEGKSRGIINDKGVFAGLGYKVLPFLKIGGGVLLFERANKNPSIEDYQLYASPFVNASIDIDVAKTFKKLLTPTP